MDETGQPGAAAPGENGNGAGPHGDLARPANGWAAADSGWPHTAKPVDGGSESRPQWRQPPAPPAWAGDPEGRYADPAAGGGGPRESGQPTNGASYGERHYPDPGAPYRAPASAPPYPYQDEPDDFSAERIAVPAPRPPSAPEQLGAERSAGAPDRAARGRERPPGRSERPTAPATAESAEAAEAARHAFGDAPTSGAGPSSAGQPTGPEPTADGASDAERESRWREANAPASAPPAGQRAAAGGVPNPAEPDRNLRAVPNYDLVPPKRSIRAPGEPNESDRKSSADRDHFGGERADHGDRVNRSAPDAPPARPAWARSSSGAESAWTRANGPAEGSGPDWSARSGAGPEAGGSTRSSWGRAGSAPAGGEPARPAWARSDGGPEDTEQARPAWARSGNDLQSAAASWVRNEADAEANAGNSGPGAPNWSRSEGEPPAAAEGRSEWPRPANEPEPGAEQARPGWASSWAPPWATASPEPEARRARRDDADWPGEPGPGSGYESNPGYEANPGYGPNPGYEPNPGYGPAPGAESHPGYGPPGGADTHPGYGPGSGAEPAGYPVPGEPGDPIPVSGGPGHAGGPERPWASPYPGHPVASSPPGPVDPGTSIRPVDPGPEALPQRVPAEPDVPTMPEPVAGEPSAETPELARIATHLRRDDAPSQLRDRPEGFDVKAILAAVRGVPGVRDASLRTTPAGAHSLRLDLSDGADPAEVSRQVARLLQDRMGLAAAPKLPGTPVPGEMLPGTPVAGGMLPGAPVSGVPVSGMPVSGVPTSGPPGSGQAEGRRATDEAPDETARRRRPVHQGRAVVDDRSAGAAANTVGANSSGAATGSPVTAGASYSGGQPTTTETAPSRPLNPGGPPGPRVILDHVQVSTFGLEATVEVRLAAGTQRANGLSTGPAVDGYVLRLCAVAAAVAIDELLNSSARVTEMGRCFVEHAAVVPFGSCEVATVVVLLVCDGWVEQLAGSALVAGDPRQAVVRATLAAVNRRLEALLV
ncbi:hypothetical protein BDK92_4374 [Micromonospora pisi]|uniref:Uncharacterized protein n=1 Tax=Micromonospora pisi TaxID=589240 RepID=A0A495JLS3_9ACTN|nr:hypothetical protein [Micromonospora pisi]RKR90010.1 hypothetical protein BDK92_4374 [Micromonospora pisi]